MRKTIRNRVVAAVMGAAFALNFVARPLPVQAMLPEPPDIASFNDKKQAVNYKGEILKDCIARYMQDTDMETYYRLDKNGRMVEKSETVFPDYVEKYRQKEAEKPHGWADLICEVPESLQGYSISFGFYGNSGIYEATVLSDNAYRQMEKLPAGTYRVVASVSGDNQDEIPIELDRDEIIIEDGNIFAVHATVKPSAEVEKKYAPHKPEVKTETFTIDENDPENPIKKEPEEINPETKPEQKDDELTDIKPKTEKAEKEKEKKTLPVWAWCVVGFLGLSILANICEWIGKRKRRRRTRKHSYRVKYMDR